MKKLIVTLSFSLNFYGAFGQEKTIPIDFHALNSTYNIQCYNNSGTCFMIKYRDKYFLITARHVFPNVIPGSLAPITVDDGYTTRIDTGKIYYDLDPHFPDVAVIPIKTSGELAALRTADSTDSYTLGSQIYFAGYPTTTVGSTAVPFVSKFGTRRVPIIKRGFIAGYDNSNLNNVRLLIDGQSLPGFSGAPLFAYDQNKNESYVIGIVTGAHLANAVKNNNGFIETTDQYLDNSGFSIVCAIGSVHTLIDRLMILGVL